MNMKEFNTPKTGDSRIDKLSLTRQLNNLRSNIIQGYGPFTGSHHFRTYDSLKSTYEKLTLCYDSRILR